MHSQKNHIIKLLRIQPIIMNIKLMYIDKINIDFRIENLC